MKSNPAAEEAAAIKPPKGHFTWRWSNTPSALRDLWQPGASGELTKGAVMAFENDHGMTADGVAGRAVWNALIGAVLERSQVDLRLHVRVCQRGQPRDREHLAQR